MCLFMFFTLEGKGETGSIIYRRYKEREVKREKRFTYIRIMHGSGVWREGKKEIRMMKRAAGVNN